MVVDSNAISRKWRSFEKASRNINSITEEMFNMNIVTSVFNENEMKSQFMFLTESIIHKATIIESNKYVVHQNQQRSQYYIHKAYIKAQTQSVKRIKAVWYHEINEEHKINVGDPITTEHITALMCYSHDSALCTAFRETYRAKDESEEIQSQKHRHRLFANIGKLLYQSFVFFASKDSKVETLYHGMSIQLLFPTLYCAFDAPTSTTTASSVATSFGKGTGIVIQFESCESSQYIRTLNMSLYTCFEGEEEHLIFETRLHIKDIFIPTEGGW
eukprot:53107_1